MPTPFNELELSTYEHLLLIRIRLTGISKESVRIKPRCKYLYKFGLIDNSTKSINKYVISDKGKMYLRYKRRSLFRFWIPVIISILALLSSYDIYTNPLIQKALQSLAQLLKNILGS